MRKDLRTRPHCDIYPLGQSTHRENKNCGVFATFLRLGAHFRPHKAKTGRHETDSPALFHLNPWLESSEQSLIAKKLQKIRGFLFLNSRSSFNMTIWSGRTQRGIASGFAAASVSGNRTLCSVVPSGRRVPYSVASVRRRVLHSVATPVGAATPTPSVSQSKRKPPIPHAA